MRCEVAARGERYADLPPTVQKIKKDLIHKATVKRSYAKLKAREHRDQLETQPEADDRPPLEPASLDPHPARQALIDAPDISQTKESREPHRDRASPPSERVVGDSKPRRAGTAARPNPYSRSLTAAAQAKADREARPHARDEAQRERQEKIERRDRWRREMAKAKGVGKYGRQGKTKLGRESKVLLEKVQMLVKESG